MSAIREYFKVFLPLIGIFLAYRMFAVPYFEPTIQKKDRTWQTEKATSVDRWWANYFPVDDWRNKHPRILQTADGVLLFEAWEQLGPDRWRLEPLTIIMLQGKQGEPASTESRSNAVFVEAPHGAEIQFKHAIDWTTGRPPPVVGGQLLGEIRIFSPPAAPGAKQNMLIETRDLRIDKRHIWTDQQVRIDFGDSRIRGRSLEIFLDKDLLSPQSNTASTGDTPFEGLDRMELIYVDEVHLGLANGGLWGNGSKATATQTNSQPVNGPLASVDVFCRGSFHFDFHTSLAKIDDGVQVVHRVAGLPDDRFDCHLLSMHFDWSTPKSEASNGSSSLREVNHAAVDRIEALGKETDDKKEISRLVRVDAPGIQARGNGRWLEVDLKNGQIAISNRLPGSIEAESDPAYLEKENVQVWSPEIRFQNSELALAKPKPATPLTLEKNEQQPRMGKVFADGPGQARMRTDDGDQWKLYWSNTLTLQPDGLEDRLTIDGSANASSDRQGSFSAEQLDLWLFQLSPAQSQRLLAQDPTRRPPQVLPNRIHASGDVIVKSPMLRAQIQDLQSWFVYPMLASDSQSAPVLPPPQNLVRSPKQLTPIQPMPQNNSTGLGQLATTQFGPQPPPADKLTLKPKVPINVTGRTLKTRVVMVGNETSIDDLVIDGDVTLTREQISVTTPLPLTITGKMVRMNTDGGNANVQISGQPAKIQIGSGWLEGPEITFNEREQLVEMKQPGFIVIPPEAMANRNSASTSTSKSASNIEWIEPIRIEWKGQLLFNGRVARVDGGVRLRGRAKTTEDTIWHMEGNAQELELVFSQPVSMGRNSSSDAQVRLIILRDQVDLRGAQTDLQGNRRSLEHLMLPQLDIDIIDQTLHGHGPGSLRSRRLAAANTKALPLMNEPAKSSSGLASLHLVFVGKMEGEFGRGMVRFIDRVEAVDGPIQSWEDELNVQQIRQLGLNQKLITCNLLQIQNVDDLSWNRTSTTQADKSPSPSTWELEARDSVKLDGMSESGLYRLLAARVRYSSAQELLHIEGSAQQPAEITMQQSPTNAPGQNKIVVRSADYDVGSNTIRNAQIAQINVDIPSNFQGPNNGQTPAPPKPPGSNSIPDPRALGPLRPK